MVDALRPQRSTKMTARMVKAKIQIAETPEARKVASEEFRPACWKRRGAYWYDQPDSRVETISPRFQE